MASLIFFSLKRSVSQLLIHKTTHLRKKRVLGISQPHWRFSGDENSLVSPGLGSRHWAGGLGQPGPQPQPTSPSHNSDLSNIHKFTKCFWIGGSCSIIKAEKDDSSFCQSLVCSYSILSYKKPLTYWTCVCTIKYRVSQIWVVLLCSLLCLSPARRSEAPAALAVSCCAVDMRRSQHWVICADAKQEIAR